MSTDPPSQLVIMLLLFSEDVCTQFPWSMTIYEELPQSVLQYFEDTEEAAVDLAPFEFCGSR